MATPCKPSPRPADKEATPNSLHDILLAILQWIEGLFGQTS
ncbi:MAG TPA: hypothetical protein VGF44_01855 [Terriglobales bacterium]|jgi:hypothetical protein